MTLNEVLTKQNFLVKLILKDDEGEISKDLKIKIMKMRIEYAKVRKQFDADLQEFVSQLSTERLRELSVKENRTEEESKELTALTDKINEDYNAYVVSKGNDEVNVKDITFTEDEFSELLEKNISNDVEINNVKIEASEFIEIIYNLFVK